MKRVYLAGPINGCTDQEMNDWRQEATKLLVCDRPVAISIKNPTDRDYRGREMEPGVAEEIVEGDLADIDSCDFMIAMCPRPSVGTSMEIYHYFNSKRGRVIVIIPPDAIPSPWLVYHNHAIVRSVEQACLVLRAWISTDLIHDHIVKT